MILPEFLIEVVVYLADNAVLFDAIDIYEDNSIADLWNFGKLLCVVAAAHQSHHGANVVQLAGSHADETLFGSSHLRV